MKAICVAMLRSSVRLALSRSVVLRKSLATLAADCDKSFITLFRESSNAPTSKPWPESEEDCGVGGVWVHCAGARGRGGRNENLSPS